MLEVDTPTPAMSLSVLRSLSVSVSVTSALLAIGKLPPVIGTITALPSVAPEL